MPGVYQENTEDYRAILEEYEDNTNTGVKITLQELGKTRAILRGIPLAY